jgi:hypothetical protein
MAPALRAAQAPRQVDDREFSPRRIASTGGNNNRLRARTTLWAEEEIKAGHLPAKSTAVIEAILYRGEIPRGDMAGIVGAGERQARRVTSALMDRGVLVAETSRAPLRLAFPAALAGRWLPGLFPEEREG